MKQQQHNLQESVLHLKDALAIAKRRIWGILLASVLIAVAAVAGISLLPNVYRATTTILVDPQKIPERYVASTITSDPNERLNTLTQQILSATKLHEILDQFNLYPDLRKKNSREEVLDYMRRKINIQLKQGSEQGLSSFSITYEDTNPVIAATVANQLAASFIDWNLKARESQALGTTQFLSAEMDEAKKSLKEQEDQLQAFRMQHAGEMPDQQDGNLQALSRLQSQYQANIDVTSRLDEERVLLTRTRTSETKDTSSLTERGRLLVEKDRLEGELWELRRQYTDSYPDVVAVSARLRNVELRLVAMPDQSPAETYDSRTEVRLSLISKEAQKLKQQQEAIEQQIATYQKRLDVVPMIETQLAELTRNYEASKQNYQSLLEKTFSAGMAQDLEHRQQAERFMILDRARVPDKPFKPKRLPMMLAGVLFSFAISTGFAVGFSFVTSSVRSETELRGLIPATIPLLATVPPIISRADQTRRRLFAFQVVVISLAAGAALVVFLAKVKPIL